MNALELKMQPPLIMIDHVVGIKTCYCLVNVRVTLLKFRSLNLSPEPYNTTLLQKLPLCDMRLTFNK